MIFIVYGDTASYIRSKYMIFWLVACIFNPVNFSII